MNPPEKLDIPYKLQIVPDVRCKRPGPDVTGKLLITISGQPEETEEFAHFVAERAKAQLCFPDGRMEILGGMIMGKRLPETPKEEEEIGDRPYYVRMHLEEVGHVPVFDPKRISALRGDHDFGSLLEQYYAAKQLKTPIDRFLGFFKVLERAYAGGRSGNLLRALQGSDDFYILVRSVKKPSKSDKDAIDRQEFNTLLRQLIRVRGNCAHLRGKSGYYPGDPRIQTEVEPNVPLLEALAERCIESRRIDGA